VTPLSESGAVRMRLMRGRTLAYTRHVALWAHRLTCLSLALALSGTPAVLAVCVSMCAENAVTADVQPRHSGRGDHSQPSAAAPASHEHHGASPDSGLDGPTSLAGYPRGALPPRVEAPCSNCCNDGQSAALVGLRAERSDAQLIAVASTAQGAPFHAPLTVHTAMRPGPPIPPPSPPRAPLALRI
jgi:hypothetical protein